MVEISTVDRDGNLVENARDRVHIEVEGGRLVGYDNGDSTDYDSYKSAERKLFSGKAAAYIAPGVSAGDIVVRASAEALRGAELVINALSAALGEFREGVCVIENITEIVDDGRVPVRKLELTRTTGEALTPDCPECRIIARVFPANAGYGELVWSVVTNSGTGYLLRV